MDERTSEIVKELTEQRERLGDNFAELETRVRQAADWRTYYHRNPWALLGMALGGGLLLSSLLPSRSRRTQ